MRAYFLVVLVAIKRCFGCLKSSIQPAPPVPDGPFAIHVQLGAIALSPNGDLVTVEPCGLPHALSLKQMAVLVLRDDFQSGAHGKAQ